MTTATVLIEGGELQLEKTKAYSVNKGDEIGDTIEQED